MRRFSLPFALVACLVASAALADSDRVVAQFDQLQASGISGDARLNPMSQGGVRIQGHLKGLQPGQEYVSILFTDGVCTTGAGTEVARFTANPQGNANFNELVSEELTAIGSISVQLSATPVALACATVTP